MASWSATTNRSSTADGTISTPEWSISHTQGTVTYAIGNQQYAVGYGTNPLNNWVYINSTVYNYTLQRYVQNPYATLNGVALSNAQSTPYWAHLNFPALATNLRVYTNITDNSFSDYFQTIYAFTQQSYMYATNGSTSGQRQTTAIYKEAWMNTPGYGNYAYIVPAGGTVNTPLQIGDSGTYYTEDPTITTSTGPSNLQSQIGTATPTTAPGAFSDFYYTFNLEIPAVVPSNTFLFRFEMDWNYL
jgi:hypothetical protein